MKKNIKIIVILLLTTTVVWFGSNVGPHGSNNAEARVFETLFAYARSMPAYHFDDASSSKPRKVMVNGNTTYLTVQKSDDDIGAILDFYESQYRPLEIEKAFKNQLSDDMSTKHILVIYEFLECFKQKQHFRFEGDGHGLFGAIQFKNSKMTNGSRAFFKELNEISQSGKLGQVATGRMVIAMKPAPDAQTTIINIWTDTDFDLNHFNSDLTGDVPGKDVEYIPRYPGNVRRFSMEQENYRTIDRLVIYESEGSFVGNILFYKSRMEQEGWQADQKFESAMQNESKEKMLFYTRNDRESTIQIRKDKRTGKIITTVMEHRTI